MNCTPAQTTTRKGVYNNNAPNIRPGNTLIQRDYGYDSFGNINRIKDGSEETRYLYDTLNRLKRTEGTHPEFFDFDPAGNILGISESQHHTPGLSKGNRLLIQGDKHFEYDERGNLIKETRGKNGKLEKRFQYNLQNQLVRVETNTQHETVSYKYDPLGRRIEKHDAFGTTKYRWTDNQLAQETRKGIKKTYLYEPASFRPVALVQDDQIYHYHLDHLGTPRELTDAQGKIVWRVKYKTYGNVALKEVEEIENNLRFQGQYFDEETGLHYNRFRYYNPDTGHFINQDPIGLLGGVNNYQYAPNPMGWIDPLGLACKEGIAIIRQYENGHPEGHFTIDIVYDEVSYNTHQVIVGPNKNQKTIVIAGQYANGKTAAYEAKVHLPNAQSALEYQKNMINVELGVYDKIDNSCLSHVCDVLIAGGAENIQKSKRGYFKLLKGNGFNRLM